VLDGGHILILGIEGVLRRDLSDKVKERVMQVGFVFLLAFFGLVIVFDFMKAWM
jgi:regulator of sigma E protease